MPTLIRIALWIVAGALAVLALARFIVIEFDTEENEDPDENSGETP